MKTRKFIAGILTFALVAQVGSVSAQSVGSLINSGDDVRLSQDTSHETRVNVSNSNTANINQEASAHINTGGNTADRNIGYGGVSGGVVSGNAFFGSSFDASANSNATVVNVPSNHGSTAQATDVVNTGDDVSIRSNSRDTTRVNVDNRNDAWINQSAFFKANTGHNSADRNVGGGSVVSGNAGFGADFSADANHNATAVSVGGGESFLPWGGSSLGLVNTGDNVRARSNSSEKTVTSVNNWNSLWLSQSAREHVTTGKNSAARDIGGGYVRSGDAGGHAFFDAGHANTNLTSVDTGPWGSLVLGGLGGMWY